MFEVWALSLSPIPSPLWFGGEKGQDFSRYIKCWEVSCLGDSWSDPLPWLPVQLSCSFPFSLFSRSMSLCAVRAGSKINSIYLSLLSVFVSGMHLYNFLEKSLSPFADLLFLLQSECFFNILCNLCSAAAYSLTAFYSSPFCIYTFPRVLPCSRTLEGLLLVPLMRWSTPCTSVEGNH